MEFTVIFDDFIPFRFNCSAIIQREVIDRGLKVLLLHQDALEGFGIEPKCRAALQAAVIGLQVDILDVFIGIIGRNIGGF